MLVATVPQAAAVIHTDFERGFIRADVIGYNDLIVHKGEQGAREAGKMCLKGKGIRGAGRRCDAFPLQCLKGFLP